MNKVTHCICHDRSIKSIVVEAKEKNLKSLEEILEYVDCGSMCKMCHPYIEKELKK